MTKHTVELWVAMNEDGYWVVTTEESDTLTELADQHGSNAARVVKLVVTMSAPEVTEVSVSVTGVPVMTTPPRRP